MVYSECHISQSHESHAIAKFAYFYTMTGNHYINVSGNRHPFYILKITEIRAGYEENNFPKM